MHKDTTAFLAIWNDVAPEHEVEWNQWHTVEHMPERVGVEGFLAGRRYAATEPGDTRYFTLYEARDLHVFDGPAYLERLNNPTPWTRKMSPAFRNFARGACRCIAAEGVGDGGFALAVRLKGELGQSIARLSELAGLLAQFEGAMGAAIGVCDPAVTLVQTNERKARSGTADAVYAAAVIVEAFEPLTLSANRGRIRELISQHCPGLRLSTDCIYQLVYRLGKADLRG